MNSYNYLSVISLSTLFVYTCELDKDQPTFYSQLKQKTRELNIYWSLQHVLKYLCMNVFYLCSTVSLHSHALGLYFWKTENWNWQLGIEPPILPNMK